MTPQIDTPVITGPGLYAIKVIVSDAYDKNVEAVLRSHVTIPCGLPVTALLTIEGATVSISVDCQVLGHLPIALAAEFIDALKSAELTQYSTFSCAACLWGSATSGRGEEGNARIWLDLPQDDERPAPAQASRPPPDESLIRAYRRGAVADRQVDELIGIVKGVVADSIVTPAEVEFLLHWMEANREAAGVWPAKALYPRLAEAAAKGPTRLQEERELLHLLLRTVGGNTGPQQGFASKSTSLPLTEPVAPLVFEERSFCFTGIFHSGTRDWCHAQVAGRRGQAAAGITKKLDYLVIGDVGNETWLHSTHGRKIEKAVNYNAAGCRIAIVSEEHWYAHL